MIFIVIIEFWKLLIPLYLSNFILFLKLFFCNGDPLNDWLSLLDNNWFAWIGCMLISFEFPLSLCMDVSTKSYSSALIYNLELSCSLYIFSTIYFCYSSYYLWAYSFILEEDTFLERWEFESDWVLFFIYIWNCKLL